MYKIFIINKETQEQIFAKEFENVDELHECQKFFSLWLDTSKVEIKTTEPEPIKRRRIVNTKKIKEEDFV